ncbi:MAG: phosphate ABC transporter substrate-binding protein [Kiritimatiellae bacterium]|jgi:phosphate transport system substrate-binding protein|nr:phosphate ABC transporter substrate-binding protein [Kiritimatiellia bacterium]
MTQSSFMKVLSIAGALALGTSAGAAEKLVIKGSDTLGAKMVPQIAEAFKAENPDVTFEIAAEGSSTGVKAIITDTADIGMSSRDVKEQEIADAKSKGVDMQTIVVARDGIAVIINEKNPISKLSVEQVGAIFTGKVKNWVAVGGKPGDISGYTRNTSSGTYKVFQELAMNKADYGDQTQKMAGNEQIAAEVAKNPNGIGYVGLAYVDTPGVKVVLVNGVAPSNETVNDGSYVLARPLYYLSNGEPTGLAKKFVDFTLSPKGQKVVADVHFVPVN